MLTVQVRDSLDPSRRARMGRTKPQAVRREIATLLAVVAHAGHEDLAGGRRAYLAAMHRMLPDAHIAYAPRASPRWIRGGTRWTVSTRWRSRPWWRR